MPSFDWLGGKPLAATAPISLQSEPPGADATTSLGPSCRTPCTVSVPTNADFTVSYSLAGFQPLTVPVRPLPPSDPREPTAGARFDPNPVYAQLEPTPAKKAPRKKSTVAKEPPPAPPPPGQ